MDTEALRLFVLAAEKLNISAAGRALGLAPAVAGARLAKLETSLGTQLLHRSTRKVTLSQDGEDFLPHARDILAHEDAGRAALGGGAVVAGTLRFAAPSTFAQLFIMPILAEFLNRHPRVDLDLRLSDTRFDLIEGSFDLALRNAPLVDSTLKARKLADDQRILCAAPSYLDARGIPDHPGALQDHELIAFGQRGQRRLIGPDGADAVIDLTRDTCRLVIDDGASQKSATLAGAGISINSIWLVHRELADGRLVRVLSEWDLADEATLWLVYPKTHVLTGKTRAFIDFLIEKIGQSPPWLSDR